MYKNALLIYNGNAGQEQINEILGNVVPILTDKIDNLTISKTKKAGDGEKFAENFGEKYELIISLGGDGTLHEIINGLANIKNPPIVGILPGGTCNDFARSLKIPLNFKDAANTIINGNIKEVDIGEINDRYFTNFVGTGLIADIAENVDSESKNIMGRMSYYTSVIKSMNERQNFKFKLKTEDENLVDKAKMIVILNGNHVGSTLVPVDSIKTDDGLFDIFIVYDAGFSVLMKYLTQKENFEEEISDKQIKHIQASNILIKTEKEMPLDTDGEVYLNTPIEIKVSSRRLKFIIG